MNDETATQGDKELPCPVCGTASNVERLIIEDEHDREEVYTFDCPTGDFRRAATRTQLLEAAASGVVASVRQEWRQPGNRVSGR
jgi:hypothetical protein